MALLLLGLEDSWTDGDSEELDGYLQLLRDPPECCEKCLLPTRVLEGRPMLAESHLTSIHRAATDSGLREFQELFANLPREEDRTYPTDLQSFGTAEFWQGLPAGGDLNASLWFVSTQWHSRGRYLTRPELFLVMDLVACACAWPLRVLSSISTA